jgi:hypothetical protein
MQRREFLASLTALSTQLPLNPRFAIAQQLAPSPDPQVKRVLVMFKCHFDAGFIDTQANVVHKYFSEYFPNAIQIAAMQNSPDSHKGTPKRRYTWTTGSWLLYEYLEQASAEDRSRMELAIRRNDIAWHALPFTWQTEMLSPSMIEGSLAISRALDARYERTTTGAKMTDVPGHTRGLIPPLAKHGVNFLDIGVNGGSTAAQLPPLFLWKDPSGAALPVMYHHEYGGTTRVPNSDLVIAIEVANDNSGPHSPKEIGEIYDRLTYSYPQAEISAASLTEIATAVAPHRDSLPVVTSEIGDTWIYGVASDPLKIARYREIGRLRESWIAKKQLEVGDDVDLALLRHLLLEVEHTWGTDTKTWLDFDHYKPEDLNQMLDTHNYQVVQSSWQEKRQDLLDGIATLPDPLREEAQQAIQSLKPTPPLPTVMAAPHLLPLTSSRPIDSAYFTLTIDPKTGAIIQLRNKKTGREWASPNNPIALFSYQTLSQDDYQRFIASYITTKADWAFKDFGKPNIEKFGARSQTWLPKLTELLLEDTAEGHRILATLEIDDPEALHAGRAAYPRQIVTEFLLPGSQPLINVNLYCFQKPATRMPEAMWLTFNPVTSTPKGWTLDKSGEAISPFEVVTSGNRHMHAVSKSFTYKEAPHSFIVETLDAPVVALGERTPLLFTNTQPDMSKGVHSNLYNNAWGTNYIMWYGEDMRFRYTIRG